MPTEIISYVEIDLADTGKEFEKWVNLLNGVGNAKHLARIELAYEQISKSNGTANPVSLASESRRNWGDCINSKEFVKQCGGLNSGHCIKSGNNPCKLSENHHCQRSYFITKGNHFTEWQSFNNKILKAIEARREELKLGGATRILALPDTEKPDKNLLEEGSISCGPARWQFWGASVYFYLHGNADMDNNIPIICGEGRFYVYNTEKKAVLIRLTPTVREVHLTVPSAWRKYGGVKDERLYSASNGTESDGKMHLENPTEAGLSPFFIAQAKQPWLIADCDTYREKTLLSGLHQMKENGGTPKILSDCIPCKKDGQKQGTNE